MHAKTKIRARGDPGDDHLAHTSRADLYRRLERAAEARAVDERALGTTGEEPFLIGGAIAVGEPVENGGNS
jgi:predicted RNA polymerase sigma factor